MPKRVKIDRSHEVIYLAGYSKNGDTVYIDRRLPKQLKLGDGRLVDVDKLLVIHEVTEKALMDKLGYEYPEAHLMAEAAERFACHRHGVPWDEYNTFMDFWIEETAESYDDAPPDLDMKPEIDTKDAATLETFFKLVGKKYNLQEK